MLIRGNSTLVVHGYFLPSSTYLTKKRITNSTAYYYIEQSQQFIESCNKRLNIEIPFLKGISLICNAIRKYQGIKGDRRTITPGF